MKGSVFWFIPVGVCLLWAGLALSEIREFEVSGPLSGDWGSDGVAADTTTYIYIINGESWVEAGDSLRIHAGVTVRVEWASLIMVSGAFEAKGNTDMGIDVRLIPEAGGFCFEGMPDDTVRLSHVHFSSHEDSIPRNALASFGRPLVIQCSAIRAKSRPIGCYDAPAKIEGSGIFKTGGNGAALELLGAAGSLVEDNKVDVCFSTEASNLSTYGIYVRNAPGVEIADNVIRVIGPGYTTGIYAKFNCSPLTIHQDSIYVKSEDRIPRGVWLAASGYCSLSSCSVSVDSRSYDQAAIRLAGWTVADVAHSWLHLGGGGNGRHVDQKDEAVVTLRSCDLQREPRPVPPLGGGRELAEMRVGAAFPNPFNITTVVPLELQCSAAVEMIVFNALGQEEDRVWYGTLPEGLHSLRLSGTSWVSGVYFVHIIADGRPLATQRIILVK